MLYGFFTLQLGYDDLPQQVGVDRGRRSSLDRDGGRLGAESVAGYFVLGQTVDRKVELGGVADRVVGREGDEDRQDDQQPVGERVQEVLDLLHLEK